MKNLGNISGANKLYIIAIILFVLSRLIFYSFGIEFDVNPIYWYHQYLDFELLKDNLFESVYYLHSQPPLFNLFLGIIVKLSPEDFGLIFKLIYFAIGLGNYLLMIYILSKFGINKTLNFIISTIFIISPAAILYENWLFYTYPIQFLLLISIYFYLKYNLTSSIKWLHLFFLTISIIVLTRSLFNIVWFVLIVLFFLYFDKKQRMQILKASVISLTLILIVLIKNIVLFGTLGSSWFGMSLGKVTMKYLPESYKEKLVKDEDYNPIILIKPFGHVKEYENLITKRAQTGIKCLDEEYKSSNEPNYNNINYIEISELYKNEALRLLKEHNQGFIKSLIASTYLYFRSPSDYKYFHNENRSKIHNYDKWFNRLIYGQLEVYTPLSDLKKEQIKQSKTELLKYTGITTMMVYPALIVIFLYLIFFKKRNFIINKNVIFYILFNILWVTIIGNLFETGENNRFRFLIEPNYFIVLTVLINEFFIKEKLKS